ncbi:MAG: 50S ribosomal protein L4 [Limnochordales bacterium]|nr:50S ribosomal protein L4 [Limnochordales bacterium]
MPKAPLLNLEGETIGEIELPESVFGVEVNEALIHEAVIAQLARQRQGTASTKTRGEVSGGGRKPWRQKGTGRARQGSIRAPHWVGGGVVFGPKPREYGYSLNKKARRQALRSALSGKARDGEILVVDDLRLAEPKTAAMARILKNLKVSTALIVLDGADAEARRNVMLASRNIPGVSTLRAEDLNPYAVTAHRHLILSKAAVERVEEVWG